MISPAVFVAAAGKTIFGRSTLNFALIPECFLEIGTRP